MARTRTYIAADWTGDKNAVEQLKKWNESKYWTLTFSDAHDLHQSYDTSLPCSIKRSLKDRMDASKTFILIVGEHTKNLTKGSCSNCKSYNSWNGSCVRGYYVDYRSYIEYECQKAIEANIKIIVLYNSTYLIKSKCPDIIKDKGKHVAMIYRGIDGNLYWDYEKIKNAILY